MTADPSMELCPRQYPFGESHTLDLEPQYFDRGPVAQVVLPNGAMGWLVTDQGLARRVLADPVFSRELANRPEVARLSAEVLPAAAIMANDPPRHTRLRAMVAGMFTPRRVTQMAPMVAALAESLLDELVETGSPADLITGFTQPLAAGMVCEMFDVSPQFRSQIAEIGDALTARTATAETFAAARGECEELAREMAAVNPTGLFALLGQSAQADEEVLNLIIACLIAGRGSLTIFVSSAVYALLRERDHYRSLVANPALIPEAVEELLRFVPIGVGGGFTRVAREDVQLGPVLVRAGEAVIPAMHATNRDPAVFTDPDLLRLDRGLRVPHLAFGHGTHFCVGAGLSRMEIRIALQALITRLPDLQLADPHDGGHWRRGRVVRALDRLDVAWTAS